MATMTAKYRAVPWAHLVELYQQPSRRRPGHLTSATELWDYAKARYNLGDRTTFTRHFRDHLEAAGVHYRTHSESKPGRPPAVERMNASEWTWAFEFGHSGTRGQTDD